MDHGRRSLRAGPSRLLVCLGAARSGPALRFLSREEAAGSGGSTSRSSSSPFREWSSSPPRATCSIVFLGLELALDPGLHPLGIPPPGSEERRGGDEVLPARGVLERDLPPRHRLRLRRDGIDRSCAAIAARSREAPGLLKAGYALLLTGFLFKIAAVPFHMWTPDVYEGAPTTVTAFMATAVKAAAFGALLRVLAFRSGVLAGPAGAPDPLVDGGPHDDGRQPRRPDPVERQADARLLLDRARRIHARRARPSSPRPAIADALAGILYYLLAYTFMTLGAFAVVVALGEKGNEHLEMGDYAGLGWKYPALGLAMSLFMISLSGIPPTAGFFGKYAIFRNAVENGQAALGRDRRAEQRPVGLLLPARARHPLHASRVARLSSAARRAGRRPRRSPSASSPSSGPVSAPTAGLPGVPTLALLGESVGAGASGRPPCFAGSSSTSAMC